MLENFQQPAPRPQHNEHPMLPVGDGTWNHYHPRAAQGWGGCGPPWARRWIKHNQKLCVVLVCAALVICGAGVAYKRGLKAGRNKSVGGQQKSVKAAFSEACKVRV